MIQVKSISLACRVLLDMHALNNEGSQSNRLMTRQVGVFLPQDYNNIDQTETTDTEHGLKRLKAVSSYEVNAISGDMNKHIFADYLRNITKDDDQPICEGCSKLSPERMMADPEFKTFVKGKPGEAAVTDGLLTCVVDDICGILITEDQPVKRKSAIEFGWTLGIPERVETKTFIHARHSTGGDDQSQMVFNRPASSGLYAFVAHLDVAAIGFNAYSQQYPEKVGEIIINRAQRLRAALLALAQTVLHPKGALTSTQLPHVVDLEGFVSVSSSAAAAPLISPLSDDFIQRGVRTADLLNQLHGADAVVVHPFAGNEGLLERMASIVNDSEPGQYTRYA